MVQEQEYEAYRSSLQGTSATIVTHPNLVGLSVTLNWILDNVRAPEDDCIVVMDDDVVGLYPLMELPLRKITDPDHCLEVLASSYQLARELGSAVWGYQISLNPMRRDTQEPFRLRGWASNCAMGIIDPELRFDERLTVALDKDICLRSIERTGFALIDLRYRFDAPYNQAGGMSATRTLERTRQSARILQEKWGPAIVKIDHQYAGPSDGVSLNVGSAR